MNDQLIVATAYLLSGSPSAQINADGSVNPPHGINDETYRQRATFLGHISMLEGAKHAGRYLADPLEQIIPPMLRDRLEDEARRFVLPLAQNLWGGKLELIASVIASNGIATLSLSGDVA